MRLREESAISCGSRQRHQGHSIRGRIPNPLGGNAHLILLNLSHEPNERLVYAYTLFCRCLNESTSQSLSQRSALCWRTALVEVQNKQGPKVPTTRGDLSLVFQITFGADNNHGERVPILHTKNLFVELGQLLKRTMGVDGIHKKKSFAMAHVVFSHGAICRATTSFEERMTVWRKRTFVLSGCIQYRQQRFLIVDPAFFDICIPVKPVSSFIPRLHGQCWVGVPVQRLQGNITYSMVGSQLQQ